MGTILCSRILNRAAKTLLDETGARWSAAELLDYLNAGLGAVSVNKPDAAMLDVPVSLTLNESRQVIPDRGFQFFSAIRNMGAAGNTPGRAIREVTRLHMDQADPDWHTRSAATVECYIHDPLNPRVFWVYPRPSSTLFVQVQYAATPLPVTAASTLPFDDGYENALHDWIVARAYAKNAKRGDLAKMNAYLTLFANALGLKSKPQFEFAAAAKEAA